MDTLTITLRNTLDDIDTARLQLEEFCESKEIPPAKCNRITLVMEEAVTNIIDHTSTGDEQTIKLDLTFSTDELSLDIHDSGDSFNPLEVTPPDLSADIEERPIGGLGIHMIKKLSDSANYHRTDERNHLVLRFSLN